MTEEVQKGGVQSVAEREDRVLVAASGTGGHLIPAMHIAAAMRRLNSRCVIEFIGAGRPLEEKLVVEKGFTRHIVASAGVKNRSFLGLAQFVLRFPKAVAQILSLYRRFKPDVVVGVGGYVSVLPVIIARLKGIPTWIHEAEMSPGLANRVLGYFANTMSTTFAETKGSGGVQVRYTGQPLREELRRVNRTAIRPDAPKRLLVLGGSQGARGLDDAVSTIAPLLAAKAVEVVHQCRPDSMEVVVNSYRAAGIKAHVVNFIDDMAGAYEWADIIISRSGASSVAEIAAVNRPALFVPYPHQQGTHQTDNARTLVEKGKALLVEETKADFQGQLRSALERLLTPETFRQMKGAPADPPPLDAADTIASGIFSLVKSRS